MESITLQELIMRVADAQRDLVTGTGTQNNDTLLTDNLRFSNKDKHWNGSEVIFLQPAFTAAGNTGVQPFKVTNFVGGQFTFDHAMRSGAPYGNLDYFMIRHFGGGTPYRGYLNALKAAFDKMKLMTQVENSSLLTAVSTYTYTIPAGLDTLHTIELTSGAYGPYELRPNQWSLFPGRKLRLTSEVTVEFPWTLTLRGRAFTRVPAALDTAILCPVEEVVDYASEWLNRTSNRPSAQAKGSNQQQERLRTRTVYTFPNEREIF